MEYSGIFILYVTFFIVNGAPLHDETCKKSKTVELEAFKIDEENEGQTHKLNKKSVHAVSSDSQDRNEKFKRGTRILQSVRYYQNPSQSLRGSIVQEQQVLPYSTGVTVLPKPSSFILNQNTRGPYRLNLMKDNLMERVSIPTYQRSGVGYPNLYQRSLPAVQPVSVISSLPPVTTSQRQTVFRKRSNDLQLGAIQKKNQRRTHLDLDDLIAQLSHDAIMDNILPTMPSLGRASHKYGLPYSTKVYKTGSLLAEFPNAPTGDCVKLLMLSYAPKRSGGYYGNKSYYRVPSTKKHEQKEANKDNKRNNVEVIPSDKPEGTVSKQGNLTVKA